MSSSSNSTCAACRCIRRKCTEDCFLAPYFPADKPQRFACVHRVFGKSNIEKLLKELPESQRYGAVDSLVYESESRLRDPVYGCVGLISVMQKRLREMNAEIADAKKELGNYLGPEELKYVLANPGGEIPLNAAHDLLPFPASNMVVPVGIPVPIEQQLLEAQRVADEREVRDGQLPRGRQMGILDPMEQELFEAQQLADARQVVMSGQGGRQVVAKDSQLEELFEAQQMAWAMADIRRPCRGLVIREQQERELLEAQQLAVAQQVGMNMSGHGRGKQVMAQDPLEPELLAAYELAAQLTGMGGQGGGQVMAQDPQEQELLEVQRLVAAQQQVVMGGEGGRPRPQGRDYWEVQQQMAAQGAIMGEHEGRQVMFLDAQEKEYLEAQLLKQAIEESRQLELELQFQQQAMLWNYGEQAVGAGSSGGGGLGQEIAVTVHGGGGGGFHRGEASGSHQALFDNVGSNQMQQQPPQQGWVYHNQDHHVPHQPPIEAQQEQGSNQMQQQQPQAQQGWVSLNQHHHVPHHPPIEAAQQEQGSNQMQQQQPQAQQGWVSLNQHHHVPHHPPIEAQQEQGSYQMQQQQPQQGEEYHHQDHHSPDNNSPVESQQGSNEIEQDPQQGSNQMELEPQEGSNQMELEPQEGGGEYHHQQQQTQQPMFAGLGAGRSVGPCC